MTIYVDKGDEVFIDKDWPLIHSSNSSVLPKDFL